MDLLFSTTARALWSSGGVAFLVALVLTPVVGWGTRRLGVVDRPTEDRWSGRTVALLGGLAIAGGTAAGVLAGEAGGVWSWPVWGGALLMFALGLADDLFGVSPVTKVLGQVGAAALVLYAGVAFWEGGPSWASIPLTFLWVIGVTNAVNLIDGIDGLAGGVTVVAAVALALISAALGHWVLAAAMAAVAGGSLGYLPYNAPPARIFMGDCGSLLLGYLLALGALGVQGGGGPVAGTLVPIAVLAVPIADTTFVTITRLLRGQSVREGGTDHVHHRLVKLGFSEAEAVGLLCGVSGTFGALALSTLWMETALVLAVAALSAVALVVLGIYLATTGAYATTGAPPALSASQRLGSFLRAYGGGASWKAVVGMIADLLLVGGAFVVATHLRHGGAPPPEVSRLVMQALPALIVTKLGVFYAAGLYKGIWSHAGTPEGLRLAAASAGASLLAAAGLWAGACAVPVALLIIDWGATTGLVGGVRFGFRALRQSVVTHQSHQASGRRVLLYGSGAAGMLALRSLRRWPEGDFTVVGLLDENEQRHGHRTQGVEVLGGVSDLPELCRAREVDLVVVPAGTDERTRRRAWAQCREAGVPGRYFAATLRAPEEAGSAQLSPTPGDGAPARSSSA